MQLVNYLLLRYEIDVGRCLSVLLVARAAYGIYGAILIPIVAIFHSYMGFLGLFGAMWLSSVVGTGLLLWLGFSLWVHRPFALKLVKVFTVIIIISLIGLLLAVPWTDGWGINVAGLEVPRAHPVARLAVPLFALPGFILLLMALNAPETEKRFRKA